MSNRDIDPRGDFLAATRESQGQPVDAEPRRQIVAAQQGGGLVDELLAIDEAAMYERPASTRATIERAAAALAEKDARIAELEEQADAGREWMRCAWHEMNAIRARDGAPAGGWIVGNGTGLRWRTWKDGVPGWTNDRGEATRYARREDAEAAHAEDEDACIVVEYRPHDWFEFKGMTCCRQCGIVRNDTSDSRNCKGPVSVGLRTHPAPSGQAAAVKALRWPPACPRGQRVYGRGVPFDGVEYCIAHYGGSHGDDTVYRWAAPKGKWSEPFDNYEDAKSAAQADYERRIMSTLSNPPAQPGWRDELLDRLAEHKNFELSWGAHPDDETEACWQVHRVNGGRNDREWTLIGIGNTPHEALYAALPVAPLPGDAK